MASVRDIGRLALDLAGVAASAALLWFGSGLHPLWPLTWLAALPVLLVAARASAARTALVAFSAWFLGSLNLWGYLHGALHVPAVMIVTEVGLVALAFAGATLLFRALLRRGARWSALIAFPATWVSFEYLFNLATSAGTLISLAYSQLRFLPVLQLASITGPWGISFLLFLLPAAVAVFVHSRRRAPRPAWRIAGITAALLVVVLAFGTIRLALPVGGHRIEVGLIAHDAGVAAPGHPTLSLVKKYADEARTLAARGAQVIVLPEKIGVIAHPVSKALDSAFQSLANQTETTIVVGFIHAMPGAEFNEARVYSPHAAVLEYHKEHLLPPFESRFTPGKKLRLLRRASGLWGVEICKDMDFTDLSRRYGKAGVGLMLVPAWDFTVDWILHGHAALMRGVEDGFSVARSAKDGSLYVSDNRGRILAEIRSRSFPFTTLVSELPVAHADTAYLLLGNWFAWLALMAAPAALLHLIWLARANG